MYFFNAVQRCCCCFVLRPAGGEKACHPMERRDLGTSLFECLPTNSWNGKRNSRSLGFRSNRSSNGPPVDGQSTFATQPETASNWRRPSCGDCRNSTAYKAFQRSQPEASSVVIFPQDWRNEYAAESSENLASEQEKRHSDREVTRKMGKIFWISNPKQECGRPATMVTQGNLGRLTQAPGMDHSQQLDIVRRVVRRSLEANGLQAANETCETILVREGYYCGRRFHCGGHRAVWFLEEQVVKFYDSDGCFSNSIDLSNVPEDDSKDRAA